MGVPTIKIENARGDVLNLSTDPRYVPVLTGTGPPAATINRAKIATADGTRYNSATVGERNLLLSIYIVRDIARARLNLYRYITTKGYIKLHYKNDGLDVWIDGYVETAEVDPWTENQNMQVSIICPQPYWNDAKETFTDASHAAAAFEFPFAIPAEGVELSTINVAASTIVKNEGHVETGVIFELYATTRSLQPRIYNLSTGEFIGFYADMLQGDRLLINTADGSKSVTHVRDGVETNYINTIMEGSSWLKMAVGVNEYTYAVDEGEMALGIYHTNKYQGV